MLYGKTMPKLRNRQGIKKGGEIVFMDLPPCQSA
jgi:hypothetical protein